MKNTTKTPEAQPLRVLILEDNPTDAELIERQLRKAKIVFTSLVVKGKNEFSKALADFKPKVILSDFKLPHFDGLAALEIARGLRPEIPFVFVSGSIGEEQAIELLTQGASDYILKDNLARLGPAVKRVVEAAVLKKEKNEGDERLRRQAEEQRLLAEAADRFVHFNDLDTVYEYLARIVQSISGATYLMLSLYDERLQAVRPKIVTGFEPFQRIIRNRFHIDPMQMVFFLKDMQPEDFKDFVSRRLLPVSDGLYGLANRKLPRPICRAIERLLAIDAIFTMGFSWENQLFGGVTIFFKKGNPLKNALQLEALVNLAAVAIKRLLAEKSLRESEERFRHISETMSDISYSCRQDADGAYFLSWMTGAAEQITGYTIDEIIAMRCWKKLVMAEDHPDFEKYVTGVTPGNNGICELRLRHKNGSTIWVQSFAECSLSKEHQDQLVLFGGLIDISNRKRIEIALRESKEYYRTLVETSPDAIIIVDGGARITFASSKTFEVFAIPAQTDLMGASILDFIVPDEIPRVRERLVEILSGRARPEVREYHLQRHDRRPFWADVSSAPLRDTSGRSIGLLLICRDISTRKRAETEILKEKAFLEALVEAAPEGIAITDCPGRVLQVNGEFTRLFGYMASEVTGKLIDKLIVPPGYEGEAGGLTRSSGQGEKVSLETKRRKKDGTVFDVSIIGAPINIAGQQTAVYAIYRDISGRKHTEEQIRYQAGLLQDVSDAIIATDKENNITMWNQAAEKIYGWKAAETIGKNFHDMIKPEYRYSSRKEVITSLEGKGSWSGEIIHLLQGGKQIPVQSTITVLKDAAGNQSGTVSVNHDISERKAAEEQLHARDRLLQNLSAQVPGMIYTFMRKADGTYCIPFSSSAIQGIFGVSPEEVVSDASAIFKAILAEDRPNVIAAIENSAQTLSPWQAEYRVQLPGQSVRWMFGQSDPVRLEDGSVLWYGFNADISERKQAEELIHASLKEKEVLLKEIHHRVKNNLQIISGLLTLQADQAAGKSVQDIFSESQDRIRSIALIHEKLYQSRDLAEIAFDEYLRTLVDNLLISHAIDAGRVSISYVMEHIHFTLEKAIPLGLIVNELVTNSLKHAFPGDRRGKLRIELRGQKDSKFIGIKTASGTLYRPPFCELIVGDDGIGLPAAQGPAMVKTLGMNLVTMLAKQLQAEIKVSTGPGTVFRLLFPGLSTRADTKNNSNQGGV